MYVYILLMFSNIYNILLIFMMFMLMFIYMFTFPYLVIPCNVFSRHQYKVSVPLKKTRCPMAYKRLIKRNHLPFLRRLYDHNFYAPFSV